MEQIKDLAVQLIGPQCTKTLFLDRNIYNQECVKLLISKCLSLGIILGAMVVKLPQIAKIVDSKSVFGLSLTAIVLEIFSSSITFAYNLRMNNPISTFGESIFITIQNVVICSLILLIQRKFSTLILCASSLGIFFYFLFNPLMLTWAQMSFLQMLTIPIYLSSRFPQIISNYKIKGTGQLSAVSVILIALGSIARVFTTITELKDKMILGGFLSAAILNSILALQILYYWKSPVIKTKEQ